MKMTQIIAVAAMAFAVTSQVQAADIEAGEKIYKKSCKSCHGPTAKGMASFPKLAGHPADYLTMRLNQYRSGEKVGANTPLMAPNAAELSDDDINNIVTYIITTFE